MPQSKKQKIWRENHVATCKAAGMCTTNGHAHIATVIGNTVCQACLDRMRKSGQELRNERIRQGKCPKHGTRNAIPGQKWCQLCSETYYNLYKSRLAAGKCPSHPEKDIVLGKKMCEECLLPFREAKKNGKCTSHPDRDAVAGRTRCAECSLKARYFYLRKRGLPESELAKAMRALESFNGHCQSCGTTEHGGYTWSLDHDDVRKVFRGVICRGCNHGIGHASENPDHLESMAAYLRKHLTREPE